MCNLNKGCLPTEKKMGDFLFCKNLKQPWAINKPLWIKYISNSLSNSINCMQMNWNHCPVALLFHCPVFPFLYHYLVLPLPCSLFALLSCFISNALLDQRPFQLQWPNIPYQDISSDLCFFFSSELLASHVHQTLSDHQRMIWWFWNIFLLLL